jgi:hypothetical protein
MPERRFPPFPHLRPILLYSEWIKLQNMDSWMKDKTRYSEKDRKKLEKGSGCVKAWTLACNWLWRFLRW